MFLFAVNICKFLGDGREFNAGTIFRMTNTDYFCDDQFKRRRKQKKTNKQNKIKT